MNNLACKLFLSAVKLEFRSETPNFSRLMYELCSFKCLKLYSLKFAIAHAQIKIVMLCLSKLVLIVTHKDTRKLLNHLKQAQKSISNLANL